MGLFKKLKKAFKKVTSGIKKVVKKTLSGLNKIQKKIRKSKLFKALVIAGAVIVTGGAAIGAFTGGTATGWAGWMMNASNTVAGGTLFGTGATGVTGALQTAGNFATSMVAKPFAAIGSAAGTAAAATTDFVGLTTEAGRTGFVPAGLTDAQISQVLTETPASLASSTGTGTLNLPTTIPAAGAAPTQLATGTLTLPTTIPAAQGASYATSTGVVGAAGSGSAASQLAVTAAAPLSTTPSATASFASQYPRTSAFLNTVGTGVATSVATGYAMQQLQGDPELQGSMSGLRTEGATQFDPLRVYAAERGIADTDISKYFTFGNTAEAGNMPLFQQQTIGVPA